MENNFYKDKELMNLFCKLSKEEFIQTNPLISELEYNATRCIWRYKGYDNMRTTKEQLRDTEPSIDDMRYDLAEREAMNLNVGSMIDLLMDGFEGLNNIPSVDIREEWESLFGDSNGTGS